MVNLWSIYGHLWSFILCHLTLPSPVMSSPVVATYASYGGDKTRFTDIVVIVPLKDTLLRVNLVPTGL